MNKLLMALGLVGLLGGVALSYRGFALTAVDTRRAVADRIRPGMTVAEAEHIIGAPPGDYRFDEDKTFDFISGHRWPRVISWVSYRGRIDVVDGEYGFQKDGRWESWNTSDGVIDSVRWSPIGQAPGMWRFGGPFLISVMVFGSLMALVGLDWWVTRMPAPAATTDPRGAGPP
ncbi:MAG TPA: hypothetical protein VH092_09575 [Urbifossiella sp.]|jgi:hypothetical protein|nr:hypothetical protein [Urbifossiella sp.]